MLPKTLTKKELSTLLDMSNKRIMELEKEKIITKNSSGSYDLSNITDFVLYERYKIPEVVRLAELASFLDLTERRIQQLTEDEVIIRVRKGEYEFIPSVKNYIESQSKIFGEIETEDGLKVVDLKEEKTKEEIILLKKRSEEKEIKLQKMRGEIYEAADVEKVWSRLIEIFKARLLNIPSKLAVKLAGEESSGVIEEELELEVMQALEELMNVDSEEYKSKDLMADTEDEGENNENSEISK